MRIEVESPCTAAAACTGSTDAPPPPPPPENEKKKGKKKKKEHQLQQKTIRAPTNGNLVSIEWNHSSQFIETSPKVDQSEI